jgi:serine/threonine protein kinase
LAAEHGNASVVEVFLDHGIAIDCEDADGMTPFMSATSGGHTKTLMLLFDRGASLTATNNAGMTALSMVKPSDADTWSVLLPVAVVAVSTTAAESSDMAPAGPVDTAAFLSRHGPVWSHVMCSLHDAQVDLATAVLDSGYDVRMLAEYVSPDGVPVLVSATRQCKAALQRRLFLCGRYDLAAASTYQSLTCVVVYVLDYGSADSSGAVVGSATTAADVAVEKTARAAVPVPVALKFMKDKEQWRREVDARDKSQFKAEHVIGVTRSHDADVEPGLAASITAVLARLTNLDVTSPTSGADEAYHYILVMPRADRDLQTAIQTESFAGRNWFRIAGIVGQLAEALRHMHAQGWVHGDVKPLNCMRVDSAWQLIDLDAAVELDKPAFLKYFTAYLPPEALCEGADGSICVRTDVVATEQIDMWALGMVLYDLSVGLGDRPFARYRGDELVGDREMRRLRDWTDAHKSDVLERIVHAPARKLAEKLLMRDPEKRPRSMADVLNDPFLNAARA